MDGTRRRADLHPSSSSPAPRLFPLFLPNNPRKPLLLGGSVLCRIGNSLVSLIGSDVFLPCFVTDLCALTRSSRSSHACGTFGQALSFSSFPLSFPRQNQLPFFLTTVLSSLEAALLTLVSLSAASSAALSRFGVGLRRPRAFVAAALMACKADGGCLFNDLVTCGSGLAPLTLRMFSGAIGDGDEGSTMRMVFRPTKPRSRCGVRWPTGSVTAL